MLSFSGLIVLLGLVPFPPHLADGRIPLSQPTTITKSGRYVVVQDIDVTGPDGIVIDAESATLDLNRFSIRGPESAVSLVRITSNVIDAAVINGRLQGGQFSIVSSTSGGLLIDSVIARGFSLRAIEVAGAQRVTISRNQIDGERGIGIDRAVHVVAATGRIEGNTIRWGRGAIAASFQGSGIVAKNQISQASASVSGATAVTVSGTGVQVTDNVIDSHMASGMTVHGWGSTVARNTIYDADNWCLSVDGGSYISENTFSGCTNNGGSAVSLGSDNLFEHNHVGTTGVGNTVVSVNGAQNVLDSNYLESNDAPGTTGILFRSTSSMNLYRNNVIRDLALPVDDQGTDNVDGGGNNF